MTCVPLYVQLHSIGVHSATNKRPTVKYSPTDVSRLQARYLRGLPTAKTDWPKHHVIQYVRLALVEKQGRPEKLRGPGQRVKVGPLTQVVR